MRMKKFLLIAMTIPIAAGVATNVANAQAGGGAPAQGGGQGGQRAAGAPPPPMRLTSTDISDGKPIAGKFTCAAGPEAVSPALQWMQPPRGTESFALIVHDMEPRPRKGVDDILHWMVWNIAPSATQIPEAIPGDAQQLPDGSVQTNGNPGQGGNLGYRPPCPPAGPSHHYAFELFALDQKLDVPGTATRADVLKAMDGHILAHAALIAPYHQ